MAPEEQKTEQPAVNAAPPQNAFANGNQPSEQQKEQMDHPVEIKMQIPTQNFNHSETPQPELTVGSILSRLFTVLARNFLLFSGLALIAQAPLFFFFVYTNRFSLPLRTGGMFGIGGESLFFLSILLIAQGLLVLALQGATAYVTYQTLCGKAATIGKSLSHCIPKVGSIALISFLVFLGVAFAGLVAILPAIVLARLFGIGALLLVLIPIAYCACMWSVSVPACVTENLGAGESMKRSSALTQNYKVKIFLSYLVALTVCLILIVIFKLLLLMGGVKSDLVDRLITDFFVSLFINVTTAVIYYRLREVKEGTAIDALTNVFD